MILRVEKMAVVARVAREACWLSPKLPWSSKVVGRGFSTEELVGFRY